MRAVHVSKNVTCTNSVLAQQQPTLFNLNSSEVSCKSLNCNERCLVPWGLVNRLGNLPLYCSTIY